MTQKSSRRGTPLWLATPFLLAGWLAHMLWNSIAVALSDIDVFVVILVDVIVIFIPFAIMLRDFLGGHFNFQDFLKPVTERSAPQILIPSQPPPPPPPP